MVWHRVMTLADAGLLAQMARETFGDDHFPENMVRTFLEHGATGIVIGEGDYPIGYSLVGASAGSADLLTIGVLPDFQKKGFGKELLAHTCALVRNQGTDTLYLEVRAGNAAAIALYKNVGGTVVGERKSYYQNPREDAWVMRLKLSEK